MPSTTATLNDGFDVLIEYTTDEQYIEDITVFDPDSGKNLNKLLDDNSVAWKQAWSAAERHMLDQPVTRKARRASAANTAAMCHDTPYAYGVAA
jgi:hypothetical protein